MRQKKKRRELRLVTKRADIESRKPIGYYSNSNGYLCCTRCYQKQWIALNRGPLSERKPQVTPIYDNVGWETSKSDLIIRCEYCHGGMFSAVPTDLTKEEWARFFGKEEN